MQNARPNILKTAVAGARKLLGGMTAVLTGRFRADAAARMRLTTEHIREAREASAPTTAAPTRTDTLLATLEGLHPDCERVLRAIVRWAYKSGRCYATQKKIAGWAGLAPTTLQRRLDALEASGLITRKYRAGTSTLTFLADDLVDALRIKKLRACAKTNPTGMGLSGTRPMKNPRSASDSARQKVPFGSKNTTCSSPQIATQSIGDDSQACSPSGSPLVLQTSSQKASLRITSRALETEKNVVTLGKKTEKTTPKKETKPHEKPVITSQTTKHTTRQNGNEEKEKAVPTSLSSHAERTKAAEALIAEGVTPARARSFADLFEPEHIARTIALGLHRTKNNPPGYLLRLIQDDAASKRIVPGSEADQVRRREHPRVLRGHVTPSEPPGARETVAPVCSPPPSSPSGSGVVRGTFSAGSERPAEVPAPLDTLSPEERECYTNRAREEVLRGNPWLGSSAKTSNGPLMRSMIRAQLRAMLATTSGS